MASGYLLGKADFLAIVCDVYLCFVTFTCGILGRVRYLTLSIPDLCRIIYYN